MKQISTVLGKISEAELGIVLPHEHIFCYFEYFQAMLGARYLDKETLVRASAKHLREIKEAYGLGTIVDCTPINLGRDLDVLKRVSEESEVHVVSASGFYYTEEAVLDMFSEKAITEILLTDVENSRAGVLKFAVEAETMSKLSEKLLAAICSVQKETALPLIIHTNAKNQNGRAVLQAVLAHGVSPKALTLGHLSDTDDLDYVAELAKSGCYLGFDRIYKSSRAEYYAQKAEQIRTLCERGFADQLLLSHDGLTFNGLHENAAIREDNPYALIFERLLPVLQSQRTSQEIDRLLTQNPQNMLLCQ